jgi:hypothetical protein
LNPTQDIGRWLAYLTFDFMGDLAFGGMFELLKAGEDKEGYLDQLQSLIKSTSLIEHHLPELGKILRSENPEYVY